MAAAARILETRTEVQQRILIDRTSEQLFKVIHGVRLVWGTAYIYLSHPQIPRKVFLDSIEAGPVRTITVSDTDQPHLKRVEINPPLVDFDAPLAPSDIPNKPSQPGFFYRALSPIASVILDTRVQPAETFYTLGLVEGRVQFVGINTPFCIARLPE